MNFVCSIDHSTKFYHNESPFFFSSRDKLRHCFFFLSLFPHIVAWFHHSIWRHITNFLRCLIKILINRKRTHTHTEKGNVHSNHHHMISTMFFCPFSLCSFPLLYTQLLPDCIVCLIFYVHGITYKQTTSKYCMIIRSFLFSKGRFVQIYPRHNTYAPI
jgi:hypothetical protein